MATTATTRYSRKSPREERSGADDFEWAIGLNRRTLKLIGIWPTEKQKEYSPGICGRTKQRFATTLRIPIMIVWLTLGLFLPQTYALTLVIRHLPLVIENFMTNGFALTSSIKLFFLWNNRQVIWWMIERIMADWSSSKSPWECSIMKKQARRARLFTISGYVIMFVCFCSFVTSPFFGLSIRLINNITDFDNGRFFPLQSYYPYESEKSPYFELTYFTQIVAGGFVGISFTVPDNFFGVLVFHACAQCEILKSKLTDAALPNNLSPAFTRQADNEKRQLLRLKLRRCVRTHVRLIRFVDAIEYAFNKLILTQVLSLSVVVCCIGFGVLRSVKNEGEQLPIIQIVTLLVSLINVMIHMFVYCLACEVLAEHSSGFSRDIYFSAWYLSSASSARDIILIMIRSQIPLRLTAGNFFYLSLNAYLNVIKNSFGYISMLSAIANG